MAASFLSSHGIDLQAEMDAARDSTLNPTPQLSSLSLDSTASASVSGVAVRSRGRGIQGEGGGLWCGVVGRVSGGGQ